MALSEQVIRERALARLAEIFNIPADLLQQDAEFGKELKVGFVSDFRHNEFDRVDQDIHDVADRKITKEFSKRILIIRTVKEYCDHMVRCYETKPEDVSRVLRLP